MLQLHPHQAEAVEKLDNGKILWGGVGTGKSITAVAYYLKREAPKDVYVITTAKKRDSLDWRREFARGGVGVSREATTAGILTVDSWNNLGKYRDVSNGFFIFDEQRLVGSGDWVTKFLDIVKRNQWILLSATPGDTWMDYVPVFLANGFYKNRTEFKREHVIYNAYVRFPKIERYVNVGRLIRNRNNILVEMPYNRQTERVIEEVPCEYDQELLERTLKTRWNPYLDQPIKNVAELFHVLRRITATHPSRLEAIKTLLKKHLRLIVFYNFDFELEILRSLWQTPSHAATQFSGSVSNPIKILSADSPHSSTASAATLMSQNQTSSKRDFTNTTSTTTSGCMFQLAEWNGHKHQEIPQTDSWVYLVQYASGSEGWNCTTTDATAFYSLPYSYKLWHQAHGRIDRLNTTYKRLFYYHLISTSVTDFGVLKSLKEKRSFNETKFWKLISN